MAVSDFDPIIEQAAQEWDVDPTWVRSVMHQESGGNRLKNGKPIVSSAGAGGLMQIMPGTARDLGVDDVHDPVQNIFGGTKYLAQMRDHYGGNVPLATAAYNAGPDRVDAYVNSRQPLPAETMKYVPAVAAHYQGYAKARAAQPAADAVPSDQDFLKMVGAPARGGAAGGQAAPPPADAIPSDDEFLKMAGGAKAPPAATTTPNDESGQGRDEYGNPLLPLNPPAPTNTTPISSIPASVGAVADSWLAEPPEPGFVRSSLLPLAFNPDAKTLGSGLMFDAHGPANALISMFNENSPAAVAARGNITPEMAFTLLRPGLKGARNPLLSDSINSRIADVTERARADAAPAGNPLASSAPANPLATAATAKGTPLASPPPAVPQSVGAAAAGVRGVDFPNMTPAEELAARSTGEMQRVLDPAKPGIDTTVYVPGTKPTEAEVSGSPKVAGEQKLNRAQNPDPHIEQEQANNAARVEYYDQTAGTPTQVHRLVEERGAQADNDLKAAFGNKKPAEVQPVVSTIKGILADPRLAERDLVRKYVTPYLEKLVNEDGSLKTDPEALYGIRENITDQLSKAGKAETPGIAQASRQLMQVKSALDDAIESGAPGYRQYLNNYSDASRPINAMEYLQDMRPSLTNAQGTMSPAAFDRFMKNTAADRASGSIHPATSLTEDQMDVLHNIHSDLKRFQNINLSNPRGSDTHMMGHLAAKGAELAAHGAANVISPLLGSVAVQMGKKTLQERAIKKMTSRVLNPNPLKYPPPQEP